MDRQQTSVAQQLSDDVGPLLDFEVDGHYGAAVSFYELVAIRLDDPNFVPRLFRESAGRLTMRVYRRGAGELNVEAPGATGTITKSALVDEQIAEEVLEFRGQDVVTTKRPVWLATPGAPSPVVVAYRSTFFGVRSGAEVSVQEVAPGVFVLPEPGFGVLTVSYPTRHERVTLEYEPLPAAFTEGQKRTLSRQVVMYSGQVPEQSLPMLYVRLTFLIERPDREPVPITQVVPERMKLVGFPILWFNGSAAKREGALPDDQLKGEAFELEEVERETRKERVTSTQNPAAYVDVDVATRITLRDKTGNRYVVKLK